MDIKIEQKIAKAFIFKNKQDRFIYELQKEKMLSRFLSKLPNFIDDSTIYSKSKNNPSLEDFINTMKEHNAASKCYVLSEYPNLHRTYVSLEEAEETLQNNGFASLIVGLPSGFSHFKEESLGSYQPNCFLIPKIKFSE